MQSSCLRRSKSFFSDAGASEAIAESFLEVRNESSKQVNRFGFGGCAFDFRGRGDCGPGTGFRRQDATRGRASREGTTPAGWTTKERRPTVRQLVALAAVLCQRADEPFPETRLAASELIERLRLETGHPAPRLDDLPASRRQQGERR